MQVSFSPVLGCAKEPLIGWIDNVKGLSGVMLGIGLGIIRTAIADPTKVSDLFPVDYAVNLILAAAWAVAEIDDDRGQIKVFNGVSGPDAPITYSELRIVCLRNLQVKSLIIEMSFIKRVCNPYCSV